MKKHPKRGLSRGEMISSVTFTGAGLALLSAALEQEGLKLAALIICAVLTLAAGARHLIARLFE